MCTAVIGPIYKLSFLIFVLCVSKITRDWNQTKEISCRHVFPNLSVSLKKDVGAFALYSVAPFLFECASSASGRCLRLIDGGGYQRKTTNIQLGRHQL